MEIQHPLVPSADYADYASPAIMQQFDDLAGRYGLRDVATADPIPECEGWGTDLSEMGLRIASVFIILIASLIGVFLPMVLARTSPDWRHAKILFFVFKYFGSGVILATAFMHLLSPAVEALSDDCLRGILPEYDWGHSICLTTIMIMFLIELMASRFNFTFSHNHHHDHDHDHDHVHDHAHGHDHDHAHGHVHDHHHDHAHGGAVAKPASNLDTPPKPGMGDWQSSSNNSAVGMPSSANGSQTLIPDTEVGADHLTPTDSASIPKDSAPLAAVANSSAISPRSSSQLPDHHHHLHRQPTLNGGLPTQLAYPPGNTDHLAHGEEHFDGDSHTSYSTQIMSLLILEFGVVFHSLFIGLSLAGTDELHILLIVITFHQFFEGLGLGSRLAVANWPSDWKSHTGYLLAFGYGITTPLGIAIGLGVNEGLNAHPARAQLVNGIFDAVSAGILVYTGLVELLAHEFMFNPEMRDAKVSVQLLAYGCVALGVALMSLLAKWA